MSQTAAHLVMSPLEFMQRPVIEKIFAHLGLDLQPRPKGRAREAGPHFTA